MFKVGINFIYAWWVKEKGQHLFSSHTQQTEEDKSWHQLNVNVLLFSHDFISSHPSPPVIQGSPRCATTARRDNSRGYGLTRGSPCTTAVKEPCMCERPGRRVAWMREPRTRVSPSLERRRGLARTKVQWNGKHAIPCSAWCRVTVRGCVMLRGYWLNDLGLHGKSLNPCRLCVLTERCVFHLSSHWPEDSAGLTCPHPQSLTSWTQE